MRFSTRTTYGLRAMIRLAQNYGRANLSLPEIARAEMISKGYLEQLFAELKKARLIKAVKGSTGGYQLARHPGRITVYDIIKVLEGEISPFHCLADNGRVYCSSKCRCKALIVLSKVQQAINKTLKDIKLKDLI